MHRKLFSLWRSENVIFGKWNPFFYFFLNRGLKKETLNKRESVRKFLWGKIAYNFFLHHKDVKRLKCTTFEQTGRFGGSEWICRLDYKMKKKLVVGK